ncbi:putative RNA-directed DNA polymerase [Helianthus annuus]|nr:putative RNA-directed DNA polymerase [Helianthus annuus]
MLSGVAVLTPGGQQVAIVFSWGITLFHGLLNDSPLFHDPVQKLNICLHTKLKPNLSAFDPLRRVKGVANAVVEATWIRNLLLELHVPLKQASVIYCDNVSAIYMSDNPVQHQRTKHIEIDIHFVREKVRIGHIRVLHVPSSYQYADIFTKGLSRQLFQSFRSSLTVCPMTDQTAGGY